MLTRALVLGRLRASELVESGAEVVDTVGGVGLPVVKDASGLWQIARTKQISIVAAPLRHTVPAVGFVITEAPRPGKLQMQYIKPLLDSNRCVTPWAMPPPHPPPCSHKGLCNH